MGLSFDESLENREEYFQFDSEQSEQIEGYYQDCLNGKIPYNTEYSITNNRKEQLYIVLGKDGNPSNWKQKIASLGGATTALKRFYVYSKIIEG